MNSSDQRIYSTLRKNHKQSHMTSKKHLPVIIEKKLKKLLTKKKTVYPKVRRRDYYHDNRLIDP